MLRQTESTRSYQSWNKYGIKSLEEAEKICDATRASMWQAIVKGIQPICFENACWAYTLGAAIAIKKGQTKAVGHRRHPGRRPAGLLHPRLGRR